MKIAWALKFSYFTKEIKDLIYSSGRRYITDPSLYELPHYTEKYMIIDYKTNNPYEVLLSGFEIDYQTRSGIYLMYLEDCIQCKLYPNKLRSEISTNVIEQNIIFEPSFQVITSNIDTFYVDRFLTNQKILLIFLGI